MYLTRRQKEIYQFIESHIRQRGYAPSIMEIAKQFQLSSPATVHKHLSHLEAKGLIRRQQNQSRAIELVEDLTPRVPEYPLLGTIAAGRPLEVFEAKEMMSLLPSPEGKDLFVLQVRGQSMIDDHIQDGDYVIVERRSEAKNGETVVALVNNDSATLKRFYREKDHVRLQPANAAMPPILVHDGDFQIQGVVVGVLRRF
ncbi:transcriptional repressor LexA [Nitrospina gracilis]|uniref:transcriptional repressor LexA n=1 Tax=Nitrospina gracilis TaxID=35801 RepID=UPI001F01AA0A|nr:transcriptional repressor LexA [Nitrospina gracilis]MCF8719325.1 repressor LexA [Nitrospina gracilis Nb-211]